MTQWSLRQLLSTLLPGGALGVAVALASPAQAAARSNPAPATETAAMPVAARLQGIRDAVSALAEDEAQAADQAGRDPNILKTWWATAVGTRTGPAAAARPRHAFLPDQRHAAL